MFPWRSETHRQPDRGSPFDLLEEVPDPENEQQRHAGRDAGAAEAGHDREERRAERGHERHAVDSDEGREASERRIDLAIAERQPGHAREHPAAPPLEQRPQRGERERDRRRAPGAQPGKAPPGSGRIEGQDRTVGDGPDRRERRRHRAEVVQADVHPGRADTEQA
jgi:hypothetical protein